ncbi:MAG: hypothetical protein LBU51_08110 [Bacteroidales bacterium]|jgi:hypothetical protein|nr:hypothetical protein [Bacteroidales bacterium]
MKTKKIFLASIILLCTLFSSAQEVNKYEKFQNRIKKGTSTLGLNINLLDSYETGASIGFFASPSIDYSYFLLNRFSINTSLKFKRSLYTNYSTNPIFPTDEKDYHSEKTIDLWLRYYFFKRGGFFVGLGGSFGHIVVDKPDGFIGKFYAAPKFDIGYSYMLTNVWKHIDNKVSVNFLISSRIPLKKFSNFDISDIELSYFPFFYVEVGVVYHFIKTEKKGAKRAKMNYYD